MPKPKQEETKGSDTFEQYWEQNPRLQIPNAEMKAFVDYAVKRYKEIGETGGSFVINWTHLDEELEEANNETVCDEIIKDEASDQIGKAMEILLLYKDFLKAQSISVK